MTRSVTTAGKGDWIEGIASAGRRDSNAACKTWDRRGFNKSLMAAAACWPLSPSDASGTSSRTGFRHGFEVLSPIEYARIAAPHGVNRRAYDEIWWISSRNVCRELGDGSQLATLQYADTGYGCDSWSLASLGEFLSSCEQAAAIPTIFYVHGNRTNAEYSVIRGLQVYRRLFGCPDRLPIRFVIWHWPSDDMKHTPLKEYRINSERAIWHGQHFADFLQYLNPQAPHGFISYSLGSQFMLTCCEQLGMRAGAGCPISEEWADSDFRFAAMASVTAPHWPANMLPVQLAASVIDQALVLENKRDRALNAFRRLCRRENPHCMGGPGAYQPLAEFGTRARHIDVSHWVGAEHSVVKYVQPPPVHSMILHHLQLGPA